MNLKLLLKEKMSTILPVIGCIVFLCVLYLAGQQNHNRGLEEEFYSQKQITAVDKIEETGYKNNAENKDAQKGKVDLEASEADDSSKKTITIHITGEIRIPGVYELEEGARVIDAVDKAGGKTFAAETEHINLAAKIHDAQKIVIPSANDNEQKSNKDQQLALKTGTESFSKTESFNFSETQAGKININRAGYNELKSLPGIGEVRARAIVEYRDRYGPFRNLEELTEVKGIGSGILSSIEDELTY